MVSLGEWFGEQPFRVQLVVLAVVLDSLGLAVGYSLGPRLLGVGPVTGAGYGLVAASVPLGLWVLSTEAAGEE